MAVKAGTYKARAAGETVLGESKAKGTPFIEFYLTITDGDNKGGRARWTGYFTENTNERSIQSLQICGWQGEDLSEFADGGLHGLDSNEVEIVVEIEEYTVREGEHAGETRSAPRVAWINKAGGFLNKSAAMNPEAAKAFAAKMRGFVIKTKAANPQPAQAARPASTSGRSSDGVPDPDPNNGAEIDDGIPF